MPVSYISAPGAPNIPCTDDMFTTLPAPDSLRCGSALWMARKCALTSIPMPASKSASDMSARSLSPSHTRDETALLTSMSSRPNSSTQRATIASMSSDRLTSAFIATALPPASVIARTLASAASMSTSATSTDAPSSASRRDVAPPIPSAPPVTIAARFDSLPSVVILFSYIPSGASTSTGSSFRIALGVSVTIAIAASMPTMRAASSTPIPILGDRLPSG